VPNSSNSKTSSKVIPAKKWLEDEGKAFENTRISHIGTLSIAERAQIANWFEAHISWNKKVHITWLGFLPIAHAHTLFIAYQMTKNPTFKMYSEPEILQKAWEAQLTSVLSILKEVDVDQEYLASLEEEMFENTDRTGVSGNRQWGLDRGHHQGGWDPSFGVPASWNRKVRAGSESEHDSYMRWDQIIKQRHCAHSSSLDQITSTLQNQPQPQNPMQLWPRPRKEAIRQPKR